MLECEDFTSKFSDAVRECQGFRNIQFSAGLESKTIALRKHFADAVLPVVIFHFQKCTCKNIRNVKQRESLSASVVFFQ